MTILMSYKVSEITMLRDLHTTDINTINILIIGI